MEAPRKRRRLRPIQNLDFSFLEETSPKESELKLPEPSAAIKSSVQATVDVDAVEAVEAEEGSVNGSVQKDPAAPAPAAPAAAPAPAVSAEVQEDETPSDEENGEADTAAPNPSVTPSAGSAPPRKRRVVRVVRRKKRRPVDQFFIPEPVSYHPAEAAPESPKKAAPTGPEALKAAEEVLLQLLEQQALTCKELRQSIEAQLREILKDWTQEHHRAESSAFSCVQQALDGAFELQDATSLSFAVEEVQQLGLPVPLMITHRLEELKKLEDVEGLWQCLSTCVRDADRVGVVFWSHEAEQMSLNVPKELAPALEAIREEEAAKLKRMELEASFNAQATQAHARKDVGALRAMAQHAKANGQDPSAALAALEDLGEPTEVPEEEELERLFVSSPNGQNHCFGMYVLVKEEQGNGMPVWRQLGGERWIYTDELGRWTVGSSKVRQNGFRGSAGFIFCPHKNHGVLPDKMQVWARFDEESKKWKKDEDITVALEYQDEVIEPKFSKRKGKAEKKGKGKGRGGAKEKAKARPKAKAKAEAKAKSASSSARSAARPAPHPTGLTQPQALRILDLPADGFAELREEGINKAYRKLALKWHPDRPCNRLKKEEANAKFLELRNAFELMRDVLKAKKALQDGHV